MKTWFITGASRGFGLLVAREALRRGDNVIATARTPEKIDLDGNVLAVALDVTDEASIKAAVAAGLEKFGRIDVLLNNAGHGLVGAVEEVTDTNARRLFDVNVFGLLNVTRAVLPGMRANRSGRIINVSSVAGQNTNPGWGIYAASKHAVEAINDALRAELEPLGISSISIEPGPFRTDFLDSSSLLREETLIEDYAETPAGRTRQWSVDSNHQQLGDPDKAAVIMVDIAHAESVPARLILGSDAVVRIENLLNTTLKGIEEWRSVSVSTDYAE
jgi:NAD(P)-dependent dehydrogenase (short-subunit alcohol dehydrogenase family)